MFILTLLYALYCKIFKENFLEWSSQPSLAFWGKGNKNQIVFNCLKKLAYHTFSDLDVLIVFIYLQLVVFRLFMVT